MGINDKKCPVEGPEGAELNFLIKTWQMQVSSSGFSKELSHGH